MKTNRFFTAWAVLVLCLLLPSVVVGQGLSTPSTAKPTSEQFRLMPVPTTLTSPGKPGDFATNGTDLYVYTGTGRAPHSWILVGGSGGSADGTTLFGSGAASGGSDGDTYIRTGTGDVSKKASGSWGSVQVRFQLHDSDLDSWAAITPNAGLSTPLASTPNASGGIVLFNGALGAGTLTAGTLAGATNITGTVNYNTVDTVTAGTSVDVAVGFGSITKSADSTITFSNDSVTATRVITRVLTNSDASAFKTFTFDTVTDFTVKVPASSSSTVSFKSQGASGWALVNGAPSVLDLPAVTSPASTRLASTTDATTGAEGKSTLAQLVAGGLAAKVSTAADSITFALTIDALADSMNYGLGYLPASFTITNIRAVHTGSGLSSPSTLLKIFYGADRTSGTAVVTAGSTVTSSTTGSNITSFDSATAAGFLWLTTGSKSGTTANLEVYVTGHY